MNEWTNEWMNEWMYKEWIIESINEHAGRIGTEEYPEVDEINQVTLPSINILAFYFTKYMYKCS